MAIKQTTVSLSAGLFYGHNAISDVIGPMTIFIWGKETSASQSQQQLLNKSSDSSAGVNNGSWWLAWTNDGVGSANNMEFVAEAFGTSIGVWAGDITTPDVGVWHNYGVTYNYGSTSDVPIFYKDGQVISSAVVVAPAGAILASEPSPITIGNVAGASQNQGNVDWGLAHAAYWRAVLTPEEMRLLGIGVSPHLIRPDALIFYAPIGYNALDAYAYGRAQLGMPTVVGTWVGWPDPPMMPVTNEWFDRAIAAAAAGIKALSGTLASLTGWTGSWKITRPLTATLASATAWLGSWKISRPITSTLASVSGTVASWKIIRAVTSTLASVTSTSSVFLIRRGLSSTLASISSWAGSWKLTRPLTATLAALSGWTGSWKLTRPLTAALASVTSLSGPLSLLGGVFKALSGTISSLTNFVSTFLVRRNETSIGPNLLNSTSSMRGSLSVTNTPAAPTFGRSRGMPFPPGKTRS